MKKIALYSGLAFVVAFLGFCCTSAFALPVAPHAPHVAPVEMVDTAPDAAAVDAGAPMAAPTAPVADPTVDPGNWVKDFYDATRRADYGLATSLALLMMLALAKRFGSRWLPILSSHLAMAGFAVGLAVVGAIVTGLSAGLEFSGMMILDGFRVGIAAALPYLYYAAPPAPKA